MIILGTAEPNHLVAREIRTAQIDLSNSFNTDSVVIEVPSASALVTIAYETDSRNPALDSATLYYECEPATPPVRIGIKSFMSGETIPAGYCLIGHVWYGLALLSVYVNPVTP